jgi:hypothetical protein
MREIDFHLVRLSSTKDIHNLYSSPYIIIKSRRVRWAGHNPYRIFVGTPEGERLLGILGRGGNIILKWMVEKWDGVV